MFMRLPEHLLQDVALFYKWLIHVCRCRCGLEPCLFLVQTVKYVCVVVTVFGLFTKGLQRIFHIESTSDILRNVSLADGGDYARLLNFCRMSDKGAAPTDDASKPARSKKFVTQVTQSFQKGKEAVKRGLLTPRGPRPRASRGKAGVEVAAAQPEVQASEKPVALPVVSVSHAVLS
jgi:hypothetical protein